MKYNTWNIIQRMIRTYRMWLFVRIVEKNLISKDKVHEITDLTCLRQFVKHRTLFKRRKYSRKDSLIAYSMAKDYGYVLNEDRLIGDNEQVVTLSGDGLMLATPSGLLNALAKSVAQVSAITAVIISAIALGVSIYALHQTPEKPPVVIIQGNNQKTAKNNQ